MSVARSAAEVLRDHVVLEVEAIDRMYLNVYVPHLQSVGAVVGYLRVHRGQRFASTTAVTPMTEAFVRNIDQFVNDEGVDLARPMLRMLSAITPSPTQRLMPTLPRYRQRLRPCRRLVTLMRPSHPVSPETNALSWRHSGYSSVLRRSPRKYPHNRPALRRYPDRVQDGGLMCRGFS